MYRYKIEYAEHNNSTVMEKIEKAKVLEKYLTNRAEVHKLLGMMFSNYTGSDWRAATGILYRVIVGETLAFEIKSNIKIDKGIVEKLGFKVISEENLEETLQSIWNNSKDNKFRVTSEVYPVSRKVVDLGNGKTRGQKVVISAVYRPDATLKEKQESRAKAKADREEWLRFKVESYNGIHLDKSSIIGDTLAVVPFKKDGQKEFNLKTREYTFTITADSFNDLVNFVAGGIGTEKAYGCGYVAVQQV